MDSCRAVELSSSVVVSMADLARSMPRPLS
jgi:hypothetical protein